MFNPLTPIDQYLKELGLRLRREKEIVKFFSVIGVKNAGDLRYLKEDPSLYETLPSYQSLKLTIKKDFHKIVEIIPKFDKLYGTNIQDWSQHFGEVIDPLIRDVLYEEICESVEDLTVIYNDGLELIWKLYDPFGSGNFQYKKFLRAKDFTVFETETKLPSTIPDRIATLSLITVPGASLVARPLPVIFYKSISSQVELNSNHSDYEKAIGGIPPKIRKWILDKHMSEVTVGEFAKPQDGLKNKEIANVQSPSAECKDTIDVETIPELFQPQRKDQTPINIMYTIKGFAKIWVFLEENYSKYKETSTKLMHVVNGPPGSGKSLSSFAWLRNKVSVGNKFGLHISLPNKGLGGVILTVTFLYDNKFTYVLLPAQEEISLLYLAINSILSSIKPKIVLIDGLQSGMEAIAGMIKRYTKHNAFYVFTSSQQIDFSKILLRKRFDVHHWTLQDYCNALKPDLLLKDPFIRSNLNIPPDCDDEDLILKAIERKYYIAGFNSKLMFDYNYEDAKTYLDDRIALLNPNEYKDLLVNIPSTNQTIHTLIFFFSDMKCGIPASPYIFDELLKHMKDSAKLLDELAKPKRNRSLFGWNFESEMKELISKSEFYEKIVNGTGADRLIFTNIPMKQNMIEFSNMQSLPDSDIIYEMVEDDGETIVISKHCVQSFFLF